MKKEKLKTLLSLFVTFFKIGLFSFGGGYGMVSLIEREVVDKHKWLTMDEILNIFAIAESTPGPISVNTATYVGEKKAGIWGGICATLGVVLPSFLIIFGISFIFDAVKDNKYIMYAFKGIRVAVVILIFNAFVKFFKKMEKNIFSILVMISILALTIFTTLSTMYYLLVAGVLGLIYFTLQNIYKKKKGLPIAADALNSGSKDCSEKSFENDETAKKDELEAKLVDVEDDDAREKLENNQNNIDMANENNHNSNNDEIDSDSGANIEDKRHDAELRLVAKEADVSKDTEVEK